MMPAGQAVEELIEKYGQLVFHAIYGMTGDWEESQDLTQETFQQALRGIDTARAANGNQFREKAWLMRIALNTVRMYYRKRRLFRFIPFSSMKREKRESEGMLEAYAAPVQPGGYGAIEQEDPAALVAERDTVYRTMARLPETYRECLLLSIVGNFSTHEIAHMLNLQEAAVRQRLSRARKQFQHIYALESGEQDSAQTMPASNEPVNAKEISKHQNREERAAYRAAYEEPEDACPGTLSLTGWRSYAERLNRGSTVTSLW